MPDLTLDLRYLKYAMLVLEHGSFRRTAEALNLSQSTISRRIRLLEHRVGMPLFERTRSGVRPTMAGERFMRDAAIGAGQLRQAVDLMAMTQRGHFGELRIGLMGSLASGFLADLLGTFRAKFSSIEIKLEEAAPQTSSAAVLSGRLDVAFVSGDPKLPKCRTEVLWDEQIYVVIPVAHPAAALHSIEWADVRDETFLVTAEAAGPEIEDHLVRQLSRPGFRPKISVQRVGRDNLLNLVAKGFGITLTTGSTLGAVRPGICFQPLIGRENVVSSSVIWSEENQNPALKLLLEMGLALARRTKRLIE